MTDNETLGSVRIGMEPRARRTFLRAMGALGAGTLGAGALAACGQEQGAAATGAGGKDPETGKLEKTDARIDVGRPVCVRFLAVK